MNCWFLALGIIIILFAYYDLIYTTIAHAGAGLLTSYFSHGIWKFMLRLSRYRGSNKLLDYAGLISIIMMLILWLLLTWIGMTFILASDVNSVVHSKTRMPASFLQKFYYTGYTLSTLGLGDYSPSGSVWQIFSSLMSFFGLMQITLVITYLIPLLSANQLKRSLSIYITSLGITPQQVLVKAWNGENFNRLEDHFEALNSQVTKHGQNHLAYPLIHYYHSSNKNESAVLAITLLDEALTLFFMTNPDERSALFHKAGVLRNALTSYLDTLNHAFIKPANDAPPPPPLDKLEELGVTLKSNYKELYDKNKFRRKLLRTLIEKDGWEWKDVTAGWNKPSLD